MLTMAVRGAKQGAVCGRVASWNASAAAPRQVTLTRTHTNTAFPKPAPLLPHGYPEPCPTASPLLAPIPATLKSKLSIPQTLNPRAPEKLLTSCATPNRGMHPQQLGM